MHAALTGADIEHPYICLGDGAKLAKQLSWSAPEATAIEKSDLDKNVGLLIDRYRDINRREYDFIEEFRWRSNFF
jgi:hypothetical protein